MTTCQGILEWPKGTEGRIRQLGDYLIHSQDDPFVPFSLRERYTLRDGSELKVSLADKKVRRRRSGKPRHNRPIVNEVLEIEGLPLRPDPYDHGANCNQHLAKSNTLGHYRSPTPRAYFPQCPHLSEHPSVAAYGYCVVLFGLRHC